MSIVAPATPATPAHALGRLRWVAPLWLLVYLPSYSTAYGLTNFLFLCNLGVILTAIGLWIPSRILLSSQAVAAVSIGTFWTVDFAGRLLLGRHPLGVTSYMWDPQYPLATRLLSLYHVVWPILLVVCLKRLGYDKRGWALQSAIAAAVLVLCRLLTAPADNINYVFVDPIFARAFGPAPLHLLIVWAALSGVLYGLTHLLLRGLTTPSNPD